VNVHAAAKTVHIEGVTACTEATIAYVYLSVPTTIAIEKG